MKTVSLVFPSILELVDFSIFAKASVYHINNFELTLSGDFDDADILIAVRDFKAKVVELEQSSKSKSLP